MFGRITQGVKHGYTGSENQLGSKNFVCTQHVKFPKSSLSNRDQFIDEGFIVVINLCVLKGSQTMVARFQLEIRPTSWFHIQPGIDKIFEGYICNLQKIEGISRLNKTYTIGSSSIERYSRIVSWT